MLTIWVYHIFTMLGVMTLRNKTTLTIVNITATDVQITCAARASADIELTMWVGNVLSNSRIITLWDNTTLTIINRHDIISADIITILGVMTLRNKTALTMINITATDVQTTGLAWASADMILIIWVSYVFSNSGIKTLRNKTILTIFSRHDIYHLSWLCVLHFGWYDIKG